MGIVKRQGIKGTIVSYLGVAAGTFNLLWLFPLCLLPEEIGLLGVLVDVATIVTPFVLLGAGALALKYFPYFEDSKNGHNGFLPFILSIPLIGSLFFGLLFSYFQADILKSFEDKSPLIVPFLYYIVPLSITLVFHNLFDAYVRSLKRIVVPKIIREIYMRIVTAALVLAYFFKFINLAQLICFYVLGFASCLFLVILYTAYMKQLHLRPNKTVWQNEVLFKEMLTYAAFVILSGLGTMVAMRVDSIMIAKMLGLADNGIYRIAFFIGVVIEMPRRAFVQIAAPIIAKNLKENDIDKVEKLYKQVSINQFIAGSLFLILIWSSIDSLFQIMPNGEVYQNGKYVVLFIGLGRLFDMLMSTNSEIILYSKYYKYNIPLLLFLLFFTITTNYILIPLYGIVGAAIATALTLFTFNALKFAFVWKMLGIHPLQKKSIWLIGIIGICLLVNLTIPFVGNPFLDIIVRSAVLGSLYLILIIKLHISTDINLLVKQVISRIR